MHELCEYGSVRGAGSDLRLYREPVWCMLETMQLTCSALSCSPNKAATAMVAR
jgi:hypothetical protein